MQAQHQPLEGRPGAPGGGSKGFGGGAGRGAQVIALLVFLGASALVAALGGLATANHVNGWYATADKAPWSPPNGVFGPVWTVLYTAMAVAAWLVWRSHADGSRTPNKRAALTAYGVQLGLNLLWTPVFFALYPVLGTPALWIAFGIIVALAVAVSVTVVLFGPISRTAGLLMLPYLSWIVYASSLSLWAALHN
jgi:tryptophan-rich sensory protein